MNEYTKTPAGWTCSICGAWVPNGATHSCGTPINNQPPLTIGGFNFNFSFSQAERLIAALEKIAKFLEKMKV
jgi:hypothetical protein